MTSPVELKKPLRRKIGDLVIEVTRDGLKLRGFNRRKSHRVSWAQIFALDSIDDEDATIGRHADERAGTRILKRLHADPTAGETEPTEETKTE